MIHLSPESTATVGPSIGADLDDVLNETDIYREWAPPPAWHHAVACVWEHHLATEKTQRILPDGHADLLFINDSQIMIVGLQDHVDRPTLPAGTHIQGIRLRPAVVGAALKTPAHSLVNQTLPAADILGSRLARSLQSPKLLDAWVRSVIPNMRVNEAIRSLRGQSVTQVADYLSITTRHLRRLLLEHTGLAPKPLQRIMRFQQFLRASDAGTPIAQAAIEAGYADQGHVTRETRELADTTPAALALERRLPQD